MTDFPKQLPTRDVASLSGQERLPPVATGEVELAKIQDVHESSPRRPAQGGAAQSQATLQPPKEGLFQRAKVLFGFGRHL